MDVEKMKEKSFSFDQYSTNIIKRVMDVEKMRRKNHLYNIKQGLIVEVIEQMQRISYLNFSLVNQLQQVNKFN